MFSRKSRNDDLSVPGETLWKIISGGQSGVDKASLDAARLYGLATGGASARGVPPEHKFDLSGYGLRETDAIDLELAPQDLVREYYHAMGARLSLDNARALVARSVRNVLDSDATLLLVEGGAGTGTKAAGAFAARVGRPVREIELPRNSQEAEQRAALVIEWVGRHAVQVLNVAGPRSSELGDAYERARLLLEAVFRRIGFPSLLHRHEAIMRSTLQSQLGASGAGGLPLAAQPALEGLASAALEQLYTARSEFSSTAQQTLQLGLLAITGGGVLTTLILNNDLEDGWKLLVASLMAVSLFGVAAVAPLFLVHKLRAGYDLYVAATFHATSVWRALGLPPSHHWMNLCARRSLSAAFTFKQPLLRPDYLRAARANEPSPDAHAPRNLDEFCAVWRATGPNLFKSYRLAVWTVALAAATAAFVLLVVVLSRPGDVPG